MKTEQQNLTVAQIFFKDHQILTKRPEGMTFKELLVSSIHAEPVNEENVQ